MYAELKADAVNRIVREVRNSLPYWKENNMNSDQIVFNMIESDSEVRPEIENLVRIIIEELNEENE